MQGLLSLLLATTALAAPSRRPVGNSSSACESDAKNFAWSLVDFEYMGSYQYTTPAHQNAYGTVAFNVTNKANVAIPYTVPCQAQSSQLQDFFYGTVVYSCPVPDADGAGAGGEFTFTYDFDSGLLFLNQTWFCSDQGYAVEYGAEGNVTVDPQCTTASWMNPNWTLSSGELYSTRETTCTEPSVDVAASSMWAVA